MPTTVKDPRVAVFNLLKTATEPYVGKNFSMDMSKTPANFPYVRLMYMGGPQARGDIEGDETAINAAFQVESFASGVTAQDKVWELDAVSHQAMVDAGFRRTYHDIIENADSNIKRVVSRYTCLYAGQLLGEGETQ